MVIGRTGCFLALLALLILDGCTTKRNILPVLLEQRLELEDTPFFPQKEYQCGPASLAMLLGASGVMVFPDDLVSHIYRPGRKGSLQLELIAASRKFGRIPYVIDGNISALIEELQAGRPVLVLQNLGLNIFPAYHYAVVIGAFPDNKIILRSGVDKRLVMDTEHFLATWNRSGSWGLVVLRPGELPEHPLPMNYLNAVSGFEAGGNLTQSTQAYQVALAVWPEDQTVMIALANNYLLRSKYHEAELLFRRLLRINPQHIAASNNLAETLFRQGCYHQALKQINKTAELAEALNSSLKKTVFQTQLEITQRMEETRGADNKRCGDQQ